MRGSGALHGRGVRVHRPDAKPGLRAGDGGVERDPADGDGQGLRRRQRRVHLHGVQGTGRHLQDGGGIGHVHRLLQRAEVHWHQGVH